MWRTIEVIISQQVHLEYNKNGWIYRYVLIICKEVPTEKSNIYDKVLQ